MFISVILARAASLFREERRDRTLGALLFIIAFLTYVNSLGNGFVGDDGSVILNNPVLRGGPAELFHVIDTTSETQLLPYYRPLTYLTFLLEGRVHGHAPSLMHLFNVLLHAVNSYLVYRLGRTLDLSLPAAFTAALLFAVHPLHAEGSTSFPAAATRCLPARSY